MSTLPDGEFLVTDVQWRKTEDKEEGFRPLHGFTTGKLTVRGSDAHLWARFNDQFLSNRLSDLEEDQVPVLLQLAVLETEKTYLLSCSAPVLDRSGASYKLKADGEIRVKRSEVLSE